MWPNRSDEAASTAADDDLIRLETCTDPFGPNLSEKPTSTAADDDLIRVEACTDPCGSNLSDEVASTAADDDLITVQRHTPKIVHMQDRLAENKIFLDQANHLIEFNWILGQSVFNRT